ncbi:MAG: hypothetical protein JWL69_42 [Phycisphaerales bacterium]|nr:hypothetical protein [Phycisphaerales bacterium]
MTYQGTVRGGMVVFPDTLPLKEGTRVRVEPLDVPPTGDEAPPGDPRAIATAGVTWADPEELDRLLDEVQQMREEDLQGERHRDAEPAPT